MRHIRYITTDIPVCEKPQALGYDFVVNDFAPEDPVNCGICRSLLDAFNKKAYEKDLLITPPQEHVTEGELSNGQAFVVGFLMASVFFLTIMLTWRLIHG